MELECTFQIVKFTFQNNGRNESGYTCRVKKINVNPILRTIEIKGIHQEDMTNNDVVGFSMKNIKNSLPFKHVVRIFPNLKYLQFDNCGIKNLTKNDLVGLDHLRGLWLPNNDIVRLEDKVFEPVKGLRYLCFCNNKLKYIDSNVLTPLKNLTDANFQDNTYINKNYQNGNREEFDALQQDIINKCQNDVEMNDDNGFKLEFIAMRKEMKQLQEQNAALENRIAALENEKAANALLIARIETLEHLASEMQIRLSSMDFM